MVVQIEFKINKFASITKAGYEIITKSLRKAYAAYDTLTSALRCYDSLTKRKQREIKFLIVSWREN
jgi:hypothetical protein